MTDSPALVLRIVDLHLRRTICVDKIKSAALLLVSLSRPPVGHGRNVSNASAFTAVVSVEGVVNREWSQRRIACSLFVESVCF
jgi:hypothetical protein